MKLKKKNGQSVVEVLVALSVAIVAIVALVKMSSRSIQSTGVAKRQSQGVVMASEISEAIRARKDTLGWDGFRSNYPAGTYCYDFAVVFPTPAIKSSGCAINSGFDNSITVAYVTPTPGGPLTLDVQVVVTGEESGRTATTTQTLQLVRGQWNPTATTIPIPPTATTIPAPPTATPACLADGASCVAASACCGGYCNDNFCASTWGASCPAESPGCPWVGTEACCVNGSWSCCSVP